jgi:DNA-directed RNA polymerase subunit RPC12/RpoP
MQSIDDKKTGRQCASCGGKLIVLVEIPDRDRYERSHRLTRYFRCNNCAQIKIVEE